MLIDQKITLGQYIASFVEWLTQIGANYFVAIAQGLEFMIHGVTSALTFFNPFVLIALFAALAHFIQRKWALTAFVALSFLLILNLGYWQETMETLAQVIFATVVCIAIGVPLGILAAHKPWFYTGLRPLLDLMQTVPTFVYLIPTLTLFGLGVVPGLISTVVFAIAAPIRLTYLGICDVPQELMDAGKAFGCSRRQLLTRIELPHAMPSIAAGVTQCIMLSLSMVVIASMIGAGGIGNTVLTGIQRLDVGTGFEGGIAVVILAVVLDRLTQSLGKARANPFRVLFLREAPTPGNAAVTA